MRISNCDEAIRLTGMGISVFPVYEATEDGKCSCGRSHCDAPAKHPAVSGGFKAGSTDERQINEWWRVRPNASIGVCTGKISGYVVLDIDPKNGGDESFQDLLKEYGPLPQTWTASTGSGGCHYYFKYPATGIETSQSRIAKGVDIRSDGGYAIAPPSTHISGKRYEWVVAPGACEAADLPEWVLDLSEKKRVRKDEAASSDLRIVNYSSPWEMLAAGIREVANAPEGERNAILNKQAFLLAPLARDHGIPFERVEGLLQNAALKNGLGPDEVDKTIRSGADAGQVKAVEVQFGGKLTEADVAAELLMRYQHSDGLTLRHYRGDWWLWNNTHFGRVPSDEFRLGVFRYLNCDHDRRQYAKQSFVNNVVTNLAANCVVPGIVEMPAWFDWDGRLIRSGEGYLMLKNGILSINAYLDGTGERLSPHTPRFLSSTILPFEFEETAKCPKWEGFLEEVLPDPDSRDFLQEFFGYCLTHDTTQHASLILVGEGANGKSTALDVLCKLIGRENYSTVPLARFGEKFSLAETVGKLANIVNEVGEFDKADEGVLKNYISGEAMTFERKNQQPFTAIPTARLIFSTNNLPRFTDRSEGIWRRLYIVPFPVSIPEERRDRELGEKLSQELPGIFIWALEGLKRLRARGKFIEPAASAAEKAALREASNPAREFLSDFCLEEEGASIAKQDLYAAYRKYSQEGGYTPLNAANLGKEVYRHYKTVTESQRRVGGIRVRQYNGIRLAGGWNHTAN